MVFHWYSSEYSYFTILLIKRLHNFLCSFTLHILIFKKHISWILRLSKRDFNILLFHTLKYIIWLFKWTKSTCINMNKIQKIKLKDTNKLWKELLHIFNKKTAMLHILYTYKTCVLKAWNRRGIPKSQS